MRATNSISMQNIEISMQRGNRERVNKKVTLMAHTVCVCECVACK